ncbi:hypothetical protein Anapl_14274 [Anas platyrhynchos]|uniref:Uncharacterized protein n=1 Tax=Anas platyrhynchos TaxID=8839 RepID=R0L1R3_ANAPL|nr:hypothetical protein Anapl_14274 [Anas platyrhynchos]
MSDCRGEQNPNKDHPTDTALDRFALAKAGIHCTSYITHSRSGTDITENTGAKNSQFSVQLMDQEWPATSWKTIAGKVILSPDWSVASTDGILLEYTSALCQQMPERPSCTLYPEFISVCRIRYRGTSKAVLSYFSGGSGPGLLLWKDCPDLLPYTADKDACELE